MLVILNVYMMTVIIHIVGVVMTIAVVVTVWLPGVTVMVVSCIGLMLVVLFRIMIVVF